MAGLVRMTWLAPTLSALLLFLAFLPGPFAWAGFLWVVPLALWATTAPDWRTWHRATALASGGVWLSLLAWLRHVEPPLGWLGWILLASYCALYLWVWLSALRWILPWAEKRPLHDRVLSLLGLAALWILLEALRGWALTGFGWLPLAASQTSNPVMLALCAWAGPQGLSGALILTNLALARWLRRQFNELRPGVHQPLTPRNFLRGFTPELWLGLVPIIFAFWLHLEYLRSQATQPAAVTLRLAAVQTDTDPYRKWEGSSAALQVRELAALTLEAGDVAPDIILLPEAAAPYPLGDSGYQALLRRLAADTGATLLVGAVDAREKGYANVIAAVPVSGGSIQQQAKRRLVPFGEYVPLADYLPLRKLVPIPQDCIPGAAATPLVVTTRAGTTLALGALVCYEDIFPELARDHALAGAHTLVVLTNDAWYGRELGAWQHAAHSSLLAASSRLPVLRCGNAGWSGIVEPTGQSRPALREGSIYFRGAVDLGEVVVASSPAPTRWVQAGNWLVWPAAATFLLLALRRRRLPIE